MELRDVWVGTMGTFGDAGSLSIGIGNEVVGDIYRIYPIGRISCVASKVLVYLLRRRATFGKNFAEFCVLSGN